MFGCLTLPFRVLGLMLVVGAALGLWLYRDQTLAAVNALLGRRSSVEASGRPDRGSIRPAERKLLALREGRADSIVLSAGETATLLLARLDPTFRRQLSDVEVRLGPDRLRVKGLLATARIPRGVFGPLNAVVRDLEPVDLAGPLVMAGGPNMARWDVRELEWRGVPLPTPVVGALVRSAINDSTATGIPVALPSGTRAVRVSSSGLILYARPRE